jgi:hypothetical protein
MAADAGFLNAPIPGMSLTTEPGNRPWENPPMLVTVEDALEFYAKKILTDSDNHEQVLNILESQVPVVNAAAILQKMSIMNGYHTIDVGILVTPAIEEMIMAVGDMYGVRYAKDINEIIKDKVPNPRALRLAMKELEDTFGEDGQPMEPMQEAVPAPVAPPVAPQPAGLMARPAAPAAPMTAPMTAPAAPMGMGE